VRAAGWTGEDTFETLKPWIRHVHFHDGKLRNGEFEFTPVGRGDVDHRRAVELLLGVPYGGYLSGEWIDWAPCEEHLPAELATMRRYEAEACS